MLASLFKKSTPINSIMVLAAITAFCVLYNLVRPPESTIVILERLAVIGVLWASLFVSNFIAKRNGLSKDSGFTVLFFVLFIIFFPKLFSDPRLVIANFFVLLSLRRLISLQSLKAPKEKIFDASLWIFAAALFHFWSILFIILVFISILFHVSRDFRHWLLPFIAFIAVTILFFLGALVFDPTWISKVQNSAIIRSGIDFVDNKQENIAVAIYITIAVVFMLALIISLNKRPLILQSSFQKIIAAFGISLLIFAISPMKSSNLLVFTFAPLAIMVTAFVEFTKVKWQREGVVFSIMALSVFCFFSQL